MTSHGTEVDLQGLAKDWLSPRVKTNVPYVVLCLWEMNRPIQSAGLKRIEVIFFRTGAGGEPVRDWLKSLKPIEDRKQIGVDMKTVEFGWPVGMPVCRPLGDGLYEVRSSLSQNRIARVLFYIDARGRMVLLHGFIKKTQKTPQADLDLARKNKALHESELKRGK